MKSKVNRLIDRLRPAGDHEEQADQAAGSHAITALEQALAYHQATKHHFHAFAAGPGYLDWDTQPDPFRRYQGAPVIALDRLPPGDSPAYEAAFQAGQIPPAPLNRRSISQLFFDSLAISAWKQVNQVTWALRVNPSSGNLHPTEGYLLCGPVDGLTEQPLVGHYAPREHVLEERARLPLANWQSLAASLPPGAVLVGLTSIHWREAWKYGERAFRYCQHDVGHAIAAVSLAAAGLGWQARLLDAIGADQLAVLLGVTDPQAVEAEQPDCLLLVYPQGQPYQPVSLPAEALAAFSNLSWQGRPNLLSAGHVDWKIIDEVAAATRKPPTAPLEAEQQPVPAPPGTVPAGQVPSLRRIIHQRRSAVAMDGLTSLNRELFYKILSKTLAAPGQYPFTAWPWPSFVHLVLFVHLVDDLAPGLYLLIRNPAQQEQLHAALKPDFEWTRPAGCPDGLALYRLLSGDARATAGQLSCQQSIAAYGCFSLGMLANLAGPLPHYGPWFYPRLFWECGLIGQVLYLEAEAAGLRGTGIGCFFDDPVHRLLGLQSMEFQSLYHFTVGGPVEDTRLMTLPAYPDN